MVTAQNEFVLLVNAYFQAEAATKNMVASGMFGNVSIQPELSQFRELLMRTSEMLGKTILQNDQQGKKGVLDKLLISTKLKEKYGVSDNFISEIENSISKFRNENGNMTSYRLSFQMGSDTIYNLVGETIQQLGSHVPLKDAISSIIQDILFEDYWHEEDIKQQIIFVRKLNNGLNYSDKWIKEYAFLMFRK